MSDIGGPSQPQRPEDDRAVRAGEFALRLARQPQADRALVDDPAFAREVTRWEEEFAALADELEPVAPAPRVWAAISRRTRREGRDPGPVRGWLHSLLLWRTISGAGLATAITLAVLLTRTPPSDRSAAPVARALLVAAILPKDGPPLFTATYDPVRRTFIVVPAAVQAQPNRAAQLWLVPKESDDPIALAVIREDRPSLVTVSQERAVLVDKDAGLVVTSEPAGAPNPPYAAGPVIAHGRLASF